MSRKKVSIWCVPHKHYIFTSLVLHCPLWSFFSQTPFTDMEAAPADYVHQPHTFNPPIASFANCLDYEHRSLNLNKSSPLQYRARNMLLTRRRLHLHPHKACNVMCRWESRRFLSSALLGFIPLRTKKISVTPASEAAAPSAEPRSIPTSCMRSITVGIKRPPR